ncbi:hypothetical protein [Sphingomonas koreensis]|uniref:hypothetical protein n=1 Tax=Sphingomonas koreensis TaxID=93064 RepID=UPI000F74B953|nr:hypothetical protein [Sphingomonas koreensis]
MGTGTAFVENVKAGDALRGPDERLYQVASVASATSLTLTRNYAGATAAGQSYEIMPLQDAMAVLARNVAELIEDYQDIADNAGQGMFGDGTVGTPGMRFANDQDTGMWRPSANAIAWSTGGVERMRVDANGRVGVGTAAPGDKVDIRFAGSQGIRVISDDGNSAYLSLVSLGHIGWSLISQADNALVIKADGSERLRFDASGNIGIGAQPSAGVRLYVRSATTTGAAYYADNGSNSGFKVSFASGLTKVGNDFGAPLAFVTNDVERARLDAAGNLLIGVTTGNQHTVSKAVAEGVTILQVDNAASDAALFFGATGTGGSSAASALRLRANSVTGRSLNAGGTINASGADFAEYISKAADCGLIEKGDVCGIDADGKLTTSWIAAHSFVIKSLEPGFVGGDKWWQTVGLRPQPPAPIGAAPVAPIAPEPFADPEPMQGEDETESAFALRRNVWFSAAAFAAAALAQYEEAVAAFPAQLAAWETASASFEADQAQFETDLAAWEVALEAARQRVDRIAFCGQVPANLSGTFAVGDYVVAVQGSGDTITAIAVPEGDITFEQYRRRIGKVWAVREGRAWIDVQHG